MGQKGPLPPITPPAEKFHIFQAVFEVQNGLKFGDFTFENTHFISKKRFFRLGVGSFFTPSRPITEDEGKVDLQGSGRFPTEVGEMLKVVEEHIEFLRITEDGNQTGK